ncbi:hypothetical protein [Corynebacterium pilosum]|uniref:Serine-aspartate repeat-containing protein n=1 Tax=Corynebacterium pilosum TaxID=35756 RepID=A0A376CKS5_9CORY|nr:hypothetical protein [Corynebacterium pilosum]STC68915.1 Serine-aspartate repeat-containing protein [Corynebacterium pilosum]
MFRHKALAVVAVVAAGAVALPSSGAQPDEQEVVPGWNIIGEEELGALKPAAKANVRGPLTPGQATAYDFTFQPGMPKEDRGGWTAQTWATLVVCEDPDVPFDRAPTAEDISWAGGTVHHVEIEPGRTPGCWVALFGRAWDPVEGLVRTNSNHPQFSDFGFPFVPREYASPDEIRLSVPATVSERATSFEAEASIEVGRVVDRALDTTHEKFVMTGGDNGAGLCNYSVTSQKEMKDPGMSGAWGYQLQFDTSEVEAPAAWAEQGRTWRDLGRAARAVTTVTTPGGEQEQRAATSKQLEPSLTNPTGGHVPTRRMLVDQLFPLSSDFSSDLWVGPHDRIDVSIDYTAPCLPEIEVGDDVPILGASEQELYQLTLSVSRPPEIATAKATIDADIR